VSAAPLVVACAADGAYALPLAVMLRSASARLAPERRLEVYVVDDGLAREDRERVRASLPERCALHWVPPRPLTRIPLPTWGRMPATTYQKLTLAEWLPAETRRAIWLDCDLLVLGDLERLWRAEMGAHPVLATQDTLVPRVSSRLGVAAYRELGLPAAAEYFNAGVMLVDLERWRQERISERALDYLERHRDRVIFWDQEALNVALAGLWGKLDSRWNRNPTLLRLFGGGRLCHPGGPDVAGSEDEIWIAHFTGRLKPWIYPGLGPLQETYSTYVDETAWAGTRPSTSWRKRLVVRYATSRLRRSLFPLESWGTTVAHALTRRESRG
jgi:lipopolysaccharide biosynthesis glycosyltransferase